MFNGTLEIEGQTINVTNIEAIDKGVDTYFKGTAEKEVPQASKGTLNLKNKEGADLVIKNVVIEKGGTAFEGYGQE